MSNITKLYVYYFLGSLNMWMVVYILYLLDRGFSMTQVTLLGSEFWLVLVLFEIPTGSVADKVGKKASLMCACILSCIGLICFGLSRTFAAVLISYTIWAIGVTFESGASSAFLYDSLKEMGREEEYTKIMGVGMSVSFISASIGSVAAGFLATIRLNVPILVMGGIYACMFVLTLTFTEPKIPRISESYLKHVKSSLQYASTHPQVRAILIYYSLVFSVLWMMQVFYQPYLKGVGFAVSSIGIIYLCMRLLGAAASFMSARIKAYLGEWTWLKLLPFMLTAVIYVLGFITSKVGVIFIATISFLSAVSSPIIGAYINKRIPSERRATILSLMGLFSSLVMIPTEPVLGRCADLFGLNNTFYIAATAFLPLVTVVLLFWRRHKE